MLPENRTPAHPGEILLEEFLKPMHLTQVEFAQHIGVSTQRINEIANGKRGITPEKVYSRNPLYSNCDPPLILIIKNRERSPPVANALCF